MTIIGVGCDVINMVRVEDMYRRFGDMLSRKILTDTETREMIVRANNGYETQWRYIAKRYAAKEATAKALGSGIGEVVGFKDIEITNMARGRPILKIKRGALEWCAKNAQYSYNKPTKAKRGGGGASYQAHISISDEKIYAIAYVVIEIL